MKLTIAVVALLSLFAAGYFWRSHTTSEVVGAATPSEATRVQDTHARTEGVKVAIPNPPAKSAAAAADSPQGDALERIESQLEAAQAGSAAKQYAIYELLTGCRNEYPLYFTGSNSLLSKEEAAVRMEALRSSDEHAAKVYHECHRLMEDRPELLASAGDWLSKAVAQNHPMAQTARATELLSTARSPPAEAVRDARHLLTSAIQSGEGDVLWMLGELRPLLGGPIEETTKERWAMMLASCTRGVDCSPEANWVKRYCKADPANLCPINANAEEMIRSNTGSDFEMIKIRAKEIEALIEAGNARQLVPPPPP